MLGTRKKEIEWPSRLVLRQAFKVRVEVEMLGDPYQGFLEKIAQVTHCLNPRGILVVELLRIQGKRENPSIQCSRAFIILSGGKL